LVGELHDAFGRLAPQGSLAWAYQSAYDDLARQFGIDRNTTERFDAPVPSTPSSGVGRRTLEHAAPRLERWIDARISAAAATATQRALSDSLGQIEAGLASASEALRFLAARVALLEADTARRRAPVDDMAELFEPVDVTAWTGAAVRWMTSDRPHGDVIHAECGDGELLAAFCDAGIDAYGVDPRGSCVLATLRRKVHVHLADTAEYLRAVPPTSVAGMVLSGVVDRIAVEDIVGLLALVASKLCAGAALMVIGAGDGSEDGWSSSARDLAPGHALSAETWDRLLRRVGCTEVHLLDAVTGSDGPSDGGVAAPGFALAARWPG
jgi:Methionine biosynthesis protein MetW